MVPVAGLDWEAQSRLRPCFVCHDRWMCIWIICKPIFFCSMSSQDTDPSGFSLIPVSPDKDRVTLAQALGELRTSSCHSYPDTGDCDLLVILVSGSAVTISGVQSLHDLLEWFRNMVGVTVSPLEENCPPRLPMQQGLSEDPRTSCGNGPEPLRRDPPTNPEAEKAKMNLY